MNSTTPTPESLVDETLYTRDGEKLGDIDAVFLDRETAAPSWVTVATGWFGTKKQFVPIAGIARIEDGWSTAWTEDHIKDAPSIDTDEALSPAEESRLFAHYDLEPAPMPSGTAGHAAPSADARPSDGGIASVGATEMTRSEEELVVDKVAEEAGRVRLEKYVVTEDVHLRVPVEKQVARVVREPADGVGQIAGDVVEEIVLTEEQVSVDKQAVAKETIRIETDTLTDHVTVDETIRKERIEVDEDTLRTV